MVTILRPFTFNGTNYGPGDEAALTSATTAVERQTLESTGLIDNGIPLGSIGGAPPAVNPRGPWSSMTSYAVRDVVERNGASYIALQTTVGDDPEDGAPDWSLFAAGGPAGEDGAPGADGEDGAPGEQGPPGEDGVGGGGLTIAGVWDPMTSYGAGEVVVYLDTTYVATDVPDVGEVPPESADWQPLGSIDEGEAAIAAMGMDHPMSDPLDTGVLDGKWTIRTNGADASNMVVVPSAKYKRLIVYTEEPVGVDSAAPVSTTKWFEQVLPDLGQSPLRVRLRLTANLVNPQGRFEFGCHRLDGSPGHEGATGYAALVAKRVTHQPSLGTSWIAVGSTQISGTQADHAPFTEGKDLGTLHRKHIQLRWDGEGKIEWDISHNGLWFYKWQNGLGWFGEVESGAGNIGFGAGCFPTHVFFGMRDEDTVYPSQWEVDKVQVAATFDINDELEDE